MSAMQSIKNPNIIMLTRQYNIQKELEYLSEGIANKNSKGYQERSPHFIQHIRGGVSYVQQAGEYRDVTPGAAEMTGQPLDFMSNKGYFAVQTPMGIRYTRNGHFTLNNNQELITTEGYQVLNEGDGTIVIQNSQNISVGANGTISDPNGIIGRIKVVEFADEQDMADEDLRGYYTTDQGEVIPESYTVANGMVQGSNVNVMKSMVRFSNLAHHLTDTIHFQKKHDEAEAELPNKLCPLN